MMRDHQAQGAGAIPQDHDADHAPPLKDERPGGQAEAFDGQGKADTPNCTDTTVERKRFATLQAELARSGYEVRQGADGALLIIRWGLVREVCGIDAVERFARQVGALT